VEESEIFTRKNDDGRNADRRLANRRLQPLGHLTADVKVYVKSGLTGSLFSVAKAAVFRTAVNAGFPRESAILGIDSGHTRREAVKNLPDADAGWLKKL
jgi:hypothetical protein